MVKRPSQHCQASRQIYFPASRFYSNNVPLAVGQTEIDTATEQFSNDFDAKHGGFGRAPKFPPATGLSLLLRQYARTHQQSVLHMVCHTLDAMAAGGLYDQIGGGFARYSTDDRWLVPHFEKCFMTMPLLTRTYVEAFQVTQNPKYRRDCHRNA